MSTILATTLLIGLLTAPLTEGTTDTAASASSPPLDQVVVEATRARLVKMSKEVRESERRFYQRYNDFNKKRDYAIKCSTEAPTGTRFRSTSCEPVFVTKADEAEARAFLSAYGVGDQATGTPGGVTGPARAFDPPMTNPVAAGSFTPAQMAKDAAQPGFRQNMLEVTQASPELTRMAKEHAELVERFNEMFRKVNGEQKAPVTPP